MTGNLNIKSSELTLEYVGRKAVLGIATLVGRTAILQVITLIASFLLTIFLTPMDYGIFFIVSAVVAFLSYFSDIGLAAALIQKKENLSHNDLQTTFTLQQILVISVSLVSLLLSPWVANWRDLPPEGLWLLQALIVAFFISSLKTIPSILLERELDFHKLIIPQIVETLVFYISAVLLAYYNWGITSFTVAVLLRGISGLVAIYMIKPWMPTLGIKKEAAKKLFRFGLPLQTNTILAFLKDDLFNVIVLGSFLPFVQLGYVGWAKKWAETPLRLIMDNIIRITFPAYSRLQHDQVSLIKAVEKANFFLTLFILPMVLGMIFLIDPLFQVTTLSIKNYDKWYPAIFSFYFFAGATIFSAVSSPLINALNAIGKIKTTLKFMIIWTILTWTLIPLVIILWGYNGVGIGMFFISLTSFFVIVATRKYIAFSLAKSFSKPLFVSSLLFLYLLVSSLLVARESLLVRLILVGVGGICFYAGSLFLLAKAELISAFDKIRHAHS